MDEQELTQAEGQSAAHAAWTASAVALVTSLFLAWFVPENVAMLFDHNG